MTPTRFTPIPDRSSAFAFLLLTLTVTMTSSARAQITQPVENPVSAGINATLGVDAAGRAIVAWQSSLIGPTNAIAARRVKQWAFRSERSVTLWVRAAAYCHA